MLYENDFFSFGFLKLLLDIFHVKWPGENLKKTTRFQQGFAYVPESSAISLKLSTMKEVEAEDEDDEVEGEDVGTKELISSGERVMGGGGE